MSSHAHHSYVKKKKKRKKKQSSEPLIYFAIAFGPLMTIPQVYEIWIKGNDGVSALTWAAYIVTSTIWLMHGIKMKDRALIAVQSIWLVLSALIVVGVLIRT